MPAARRTSQRHRLRHPCDVLTETRSPSSSSPRLHRFPPGPEAVSQQQPRCIANQLLVGSLPGCTAFPHPRTAGGMSVPVCVRLLLHALWAAFLLKMASAD